MKLIIRMVLIVSLSSVAALIVFPQKMPPVRIEGTYENLTVGKGSGDLEGMRVMLIDGGGGIHAIVQEAGGGVELPDPATAKVDVEGAKVSFSIKFPGQDEAQTFSGTVTAAGLRLRRGDPTRPSFLGSLPGDRPFFLKRRKC